MALLGEPMWRLKLKSFHTSDRHTVEKKAFEEAIERRQQRSCLPPLKDSDVKIAPGVRVKINGLTSNTGSYINGRMGTVIEWFGEKERWSVMVDDDQVIDIHLKGTSLLIRPQNLVFYEKLWLTTEGRGGVELPPRPSFFKLQVMQQDGTVRDARNLFEWIQQFCIEQCAVVLRLKEKSVRYMDDVCALAIADEFEVPQNCMGCARWWTDEDLFLELVKERRYKEQVVRFARVVLSKAHEKGHLIADLVEPYIKPPVATSFPCAPHELESWLVKVSQGEYGGSFRTVGNVKVFSEWDTEDCSFSAYTLAPAPCFIECAGRSEDLWINVLCEKDMEDTLAEQLANDVAQRLRLGLPAHPE